MVKFFVLPIACCVLLFAAVGVQAAQLRLEPSVSSYGVGDVVKMDLWLDTQTDTFNALEAQVRFEKEAFSFESFLDAGSIVGAWIERPRVLTGDTQVRLAGMIPGGFQGSEGYIGSLLLRAKKSGSTIVGMEDALVYAHDGQGTGVAVAAVTKRIHISDTKIKTEPSDPDRSAPEDFFVHLAQDPSIFSGGWFIAFGTQDKQTGIDYYTVQEGARRVIRTQSPYLLENQRLDGSITVRAVDRAGNIREVRLPATREQVWYFRYLSLEIVLVFLFLFVLGKSVWRLLIRRS